MKHTYKYTYTFKNGNETIEAQGYNLWKGAENAGLVITRADRLSIYYLQKTKFEDRVRNVWATKIGDAMNGSSLWEVSQKYTK